MRITNFFLTCLFVTMLSCGHQNREKKSIINEFANRNIEFADSVRFVVILPASGCGNCIREGFNFISRNLRHFNCNNEAIQIIFTSIQSPKMLLRTLGIEAFEYHCFKVDFDNRYRLSGVNAAFPLILYLENGEITDLEFQSPNNTLAFHRLEEELNI